jgi:hypothetical protein
MSFQQVVSLDQCFGLLRLRKAGAPPNDPERWKHSGTGEVEDPYSENCLQSVLCVHRIDSQIADPSISLIGPQRIHGLSGWQLARPTVRSRQRNP